MNSVRFKNLYDAITSHIDYCNMIESYGEDFVTFSTTNFDLLKVLFGGFYLTLIMEDYIVKKDDDTIESKLVPEFVKYLVSKIAKDNGHGYSVGDLCYKDEYTVLEKVRNKLAHGDFIVENGEIIFDEKGIEGRINIDNFLKFITAFEQEKDNFKSYGTRTKMFQLCENKSKLKSINKSKDFDNTCSNLYKIEIIDSPIFPRTRTASYCEELRDFYKIMGNKNNLNDKGKIIDILDKAQTMLKQRGISLIYSVKKLTELEEYDSIKAKYMENIGTYRELGIPQQLQTICNFTNRISKGKFQKFDLQKGIFTNELLLKKFSENHDYTLDEIVSEIPNLAAIFLHHYDSSILTAYLVGFNSLYEYGLEKGLTLKGSYNWVSIFDGTSLDFSKLNIDFLDEPNMVIEHDFSKYETDIFEYENKCITAIDKLIFKHEQNLKNYLEKCKNPSKEKEEQLRLNVIDAKEEKLNLLNKIEQLKQEFEKFDLEKYTRNINIIIHLRNAIAHGNVFIDCYSNDMDNTEVKIIDYLDDEVVYEKQIKMEEFVKLFLGENISVIFDFIESNLKDPELINQEFIDELSLRVKMRELKFETK